jgi:hypothetical protein
MSGFWLVESRASKWGEGRIHLASDGAPTALGLHISRCVKTQSHRYRGPLKNVTCKICLRLHAKGDTT